MINGHGDEYVGELEANFSSNVWYGADNSALCKHLYSQMYTIERYPDTEASSLKQLLAENNHIKTNQLLICNGSTEAFYLIANAFSGSKSSIVTPTFSEYADACRMHNHNVRLTNRTDLNTHIKIVKPDLVWICNPNNPDGNCFETTEIIQLLTNYPDSIFVIDQAYIHFTQREICVVNEIHKYPNLIIVQSLTKRHAIPGLRLGYLIASETIITRISQFRMPWSVNSLAIEAGKFILKNKKDGFQLHNWLCECEILRNKIDSFDCFKSIPSETPYFLVKLNKGKASDLNTFLLSHKILVRQATNFEGLEGEHIRICTLSREKNDLLINKLKQWSRSVTQL
jgi:threonine-phosphate decarboxylase